MDDDQVIAILPADSGKNVLLQTKGGVFLRFSLDEFRKRKKAPSACGASAFPMATHLKLPV